MSWWHPETTLKLHYDLEFCTSHDNMASPTQTTLSPPVEHFDPCCNISSLLVDSCNPDKVSRKFLCLQSNWRKKQEQWRQCISQQFRGSLSNKNCFISSATKITDCIWVGIIWNHFFYSAFGAVHRCQAFCSNNISKLSSATCISSNRNDLQRGDPCSSCPISHHLQSFFRGTFNFIQKYCH